MQTSPSGGDIGLQQETCLNSVPAVVAALLIEKKSSDTNKELLTAAVDVTLTLAGVAEVTAAIKAYQGAKTVASLYRLTLSVSDLAASYADLACRDNQSELCAQWREISFYVQIGLLTFNAANGLEALLNRSEGLVEAGRLAKGADKLLDKALIAELKLAGVKFTEADLKWIFKRGDGKIIFLEKGNASAGFEHILSHKDDFIAKGIAEEDISDFVMSALKENKIIDYQGSGTGRPIYEVVYKGTKQRVAITTGSNGFVVGANPKSF